MKYFSYDLFPCYISQKSFYGKARVFVTEDRGVCDYVLRSYGRAVASVHVGSDNIPYVKRLWNDYSATTMRHVNEMFMQSRFPKLSARAWRAMEVGKFYCPDDVPALEKSRK